jgi:hypothetical protein
VSHLPQRAFLVGLGGYVIAVLVAGYSAVQHPESYIHVTPLQGFGIATAWKVVYFLEIAAGAMMALIVFRSPLPRIRATWLVGCGALVALLARFLPAFPSIVGTCPVGQVCNPYDWGQSLEWLRVLLLSFAAIAMLVAFVSRTGGSPPNKSLERTREG